MPRSSGNYTPPASSWNPPINGASATPADWIALLADLAAALTQSVSKDGQTTMTGNLPMGGNKVTGAGDAVSASDLTTLSQVQALLAGLSLVIGANAVGTTNIQDDAVTYDKIQNISAQNLLLGRKTTGAGNTEECTLSQVLDMIGSATQGDILFRGASAWQRLGYGTLGQVLKTQGVGQDVVWGSIGIIGGVFRNLTISTTGTSHTITITADALVLADTSELTKIVTGVSVTAALTTAGANGLDTGSKAPSTWYTVWVINNGSTTAALLSTSTTSPTMPSGYTFKMRVGWIQSDSSGNNYPYSMLQKGKNVQWKVAGGSNVANVRQMASGTASRWTAVSVTGVVPTTACKITVSIVPVSASSYASVTANNSYGAYNSTNAPICSSLAGSAFGGSTSSEFVLESSNIYWEATGATAYLNCIGWEDNL